MKRVLILLFAFVSFSFTGIAQSLDKASAQLEVVRLKSGEQSQDYLSALDSVILYASLSGELETAISYRKTHLSLVKQMKGDSCVEVADDLWRLANTYFRNGDSDNSLSNYLHAATLFEANANNKKLELVYAERYIYCLWSILEHYKLQMDKDGVSFYSAKLAEFSTNYYGISSSDNFEVIASIGYFNDQVGNKEGAFNYCNMIVDNCMAIDSSNYKNVDAAYKFIKSHYYNKSEYELMISAAIEHLNKLDLAQSILPMK